MNFSANKLVLISLFIWVTGSAHTNEDNKLSFLLNSLYPTMEATMPHQLAQLMNKVLVWAKDIEEKRKYFQKALNSRILKNKKIMRF